MTMLASVLALTFVGPVTDASAQLSASNKMGVAMGHLHYYVEDVEAHKKFWIAMGGQAARKLGATEVIKFPDVLILLTQGKPSGGNAGAVVSHVAFKVPNLKQAIAKWEAAGIKVLHNTTSTSVLANLVMPNGDRVEIFEELLPNSSFFARFALPPDPDDYSAQRHGRKMTVPVVAHHIHLQLPKGGDTEGQDWYVKMFGAKPGIRWLYKAADLPGINMNFSGESATANAPTKGRMLDHIGFEVKNLEAFCKKLQANGVKFDVPYTKNSMGIGTAFLTDPWGTYIELTEGLNGL